MWPAFLLPGVVAAGITCVVLVGIWCYDWYESPPEQKRPVKLLPALAGAALGSLVNGGVLGFLLMTFSVKGPAGPEGTLGVWLGILGGAAACFGYIGLNQSGSPIPPWRVSWGLFLSTLIGGGPLVIGYFAVLAYVIWKEIRNQKRRQGANSLLPDQPYQGPEGTGTNRLNGGIQDNSDLTNR